MVRFDSQINPENQPSQAQKTGKVAPMPVGRAKDYVTDTHVEGAVRVKRSGAFSGFSRREITPEVQQRLQDVVAFVDALDSSFDNRSAIRDFLRTFKFGKLMDTLPFLTSTDEGLLRELSEEIKSGQVDFSKWQEMYDTGGPVIAALMMTELGLENPSTYRMSSRVQFYSKEHKRVGDKQVERVFCFLRAFSRSQREGMAALKASVKSSFNEKTAHHDVLHTRRIFMALSKGDISLDQEGITAFRDVVNFVEAKSKSTSLIYVARYALKHVEGGFDVEIPEGYVPPALQGRSLSDILLDDSVNIDQKLPLINRLVSQGALDNDLAISFVDYASTRSFHTENRGEIAYAEFKLKYGDRGVDGFVDYVNEFRNELLKFDSVAGFKDAFERSQVGMIPYRLSVIKQLRDVVLSPAQRRKLSESFNLLLKAVRGVDHKSRASVLRAVHYFKLPLPDVDDSDFMGLALLPQDQRSAEYVLRQLCKHKGGLSKQSLLTLINRETPLVSGDIRNLNEGFRSYYSNLLLNLTEKSFAERYLADDGLELLHESVKRGFTDFTAKMVGIISKGSDELKARFVRQLPTLIQDARESTPIPDQLLATPFPTLIAAAKDMNVPLDQVLDGDLDFSRIIRQRLLSADAQQRGFVADESQVFVRAEAGKYLLDELGFERVGQSSLNYYFSSSYEEGSPIDRDALKMIQKHVVSQLSPYEVFGMFVAFSRKGSNDSAKLLIRLEDSELLEAVVEKVRAYENGQYLNRFLGELLQIARDQNSSWGVAKVARQAFKFGGEVAFKDQDYLKVLSSTDPDVACKVLDAVVSSGEVEISRDSFFNLMDVNFQESPFETRRAVLKHIVETHWSDDWRSAFLLNESGDIGGLDLIYAFGGESLLSEVMVKFETSGEFGSVSEEVSALAIQAARDQHFELAAQLMKFDGMVEFRTRTEEPYYESLSLRDFVSGQYAHEGSRLVSRYQSVMAAFPDVDAAEFGPVGSELIRYSGTVHLDEGGDGYSQSVWSPKFLAQLFETGVNINEQRQAFVDSCYRSLGTTQPTLKQRASMLSQRFKGVLPDELMLYTEQDILSGNMSNGVLISDAVDLYFSRVDEMLDANDKPKNLERYISTMETLLFYLSQDDVDERAINRTVVQIFSLSEMKHICGPGRIGRMLELTDSLSPAPQVFKDFKSQVRKAVTSMADRYEARMCDEDSDVKAARARLAEVQAQEGQEGEDEHEVEIKMDLAKRELDVVIEKFYKRIEGNRIHHERIFWMQAQKFGFASSDDFEDGYVNKRAVKNFNNSSKLLRQIMREISPEQIVEFQITSREHDALMDDFRAGIALMKAYNEHVRQNGDAKFERQSEINDFRDRFETFLKDAEVDNVEQIMVGLGTEIEIDGEYYPAYNPGAIEYLVGSENRSPLTQEWKDKINLALRKRCYQALKQSGDIVSLSHVAGTDDLDHPEEYQFLTYLHAARGAEVSEHVETPTSDDVVEAGVQKSSKLVKILEHLDEWDDFVVQDQRRVDKYLRIIENGIETDGIADAFAKLHELGWRPSVQETERLMQRFMNNSYFTSIAMLNQLIQTFWDPQLFVQSGELKHLDVLLRVDQETFDFVMERIDLSGLSVSHSQSRMALKYADSVADRLGAFKDVQGIQWSGVRAGHNVVSIGLVTLPQDKHKDFLDQLLTVDQFYAFPKRVQDQIIRDINLYCTPDVIDHMSFRADMGGRLPVLKLGVSLDLLRSSTDVDHIMKVMDLQLKFPTEQQYLEMLKFLMSNSCQIPFRSRRPLARRLLRGLHDSDHLAKAKAKWKNYAVSQTGYRLQ